MKRALFIVAVLMLVVPVAAQAATLTVDRAQRAALGEARERADQEKDGRGVAVGECARRGARRVICRVSWEYTEEFDRRERIDCTVRDRICTLEEEKRWATAERKCTARVSVRLTSARSRRATAVLTGQDCNPFFPRAKQG
ncbi:MAG: hypothetical protein ACR2LY_03210 [Thermoleophilaceae bacterium]